MSSSTSQILIGVATAAGVATLLYCLLKEEPKSTKSDTTRDNQGSGSAAPSGAGKITKDELLVILKNIAKSQEEMKSTMAELMNDVITLKPDFPAMYALVQQKTPEDPLEKAGITMQEFDTMLDANQDDPEIRRAIMTLMGADGPQTASAEVTQKVQGLTVAKIREIHEYMLTDLRGLVGQAERVQNPDGKTIAITAQALVGAKVQAKFGLSAEEVEAAVRHHHSSLAVDQDFATLALQVQQIMGRLMSSGA